MKIIAGTGHRIGLLNTIERVKIKNVLKDYILSSNPDMIISGMALGFDQILAEVSIDLDIPLTCAIPFKGQELKWNDCDINFYNNILYKATRTVICSKGGYSVNKLMLRNKWMIDRCTDVVALYDGRLYGGTYNCIKYAKKCDIPIINLWNKYNDCI